MSSKKDIKDKEGVKALVARVMVDISHQGIPYQPNNLIEDTPEAIELLEDAGSVSTNDADLAYCKDELGVKIRVHSEELTKIAEKTKAASAKAAKKAK